MQQLTTSLTMVTTLQNLLFQSTCPPLLIINFQTATRARHLSLLVAMRNFTIPSSSERSVNSDDTKASLPTQREFNTLSDKEPNPTQLMVDGAVPISHYENTVNTNSASPQAMDEVDDDSIGSG